MRDLISLRVSLAIYSQSQVQSLDNYENTFGVYDLGSSLPYAEPSSSTGPSKESMIVNKRFELYCPHDHDLVKRSHTFLCI
ncbi:hypothetical protein L6452_44063 [Arctium lappa]|uniref:Uncharacterized protein n=1 Tax=Arctium lappa TaxID=4217 RepID=A0ACB8XEU6_ARCLA|nr:hypothetical protein L6452_44063 [Arctium lappa]